MPRMLIADDHALIRDGLGSQLRTLGDDVVILEAHDWPGTFAAASDAALELALVDLHMPGREGVTALAELVHLAPGLPVLVLSASEDARDMRDVLRAGAMGYLTKREPSAVMLAAVRLVLGGGMYVPPALAGVAVREPTPVLTARQLDVLRLLVEGYSNQDIAQALHLATPTVKVHLAAIFRALEVDNRTQAAVAAQRLGLHHPAR